VVPHVNTTTSHNKVSPFHSRIMYFLHIHKSGGTCLCQAAHFNKMAAPETNCNPQADQRCCGGEDSIEAQQKFARTTNLTFVANEGAMYEAMDVEHYRYILLLRKSRARYKSHWQHVYRNHKNASSFVAWWERQPDNWNLRMICGPRCMNVPKYQISKGLFDYTIDRLLKFEHFLFLENFNQSFIQFARFVHWRIMPVRLRRSSQNLIYPDDTAAEDWDLGMSALDDAIYEVAGHVYSQHGHASALSASSSSSSSTKDLMNLSTETRRGLDLYFQQGPKRNCRNLCCHDTCSQY